ncbi:transposase [Lewinella sp. LCG006]|uniref:transposase n=1 Tax=Lewinella sp. LCG006 TaxID=3231911 RepID=UPI00345F61A1
MAKEPDKKFQTEGKYNRTFSKAFKQSKVRDLKAGVVQIKDLCELYSISRTSVYNWLYLYSEAEKGVKTVIQMDSEQFKTQLLLQRVAELERSVGQKQLEIDYLQSCLTVASEELGYDIKKKYGPPRWNDSAEEEPKKQGQ